MFTIYVYVLDTLADWELGHVTSELHSGRFSKRMQGVYRLKRLALQRNQSIQWGV